LGYRALSSLAGPLPPGYGQIALVGRARVRPDLRAQRKRLLGRRKKKKQLISETIKSQ
jgi:hypothetical protein